MSDRIVSVGPEATVGEAIAQMEQNDIHELPVMQNSSLKGWISYTTLLRRGGVPAATKVAQVMEHPPRLQKEADVVEAAELMIKNNVRALPVVNTKGQVVGILSRTDVLKVVLQTPSIGNLALAGVMNRDLETVEEDERVDKALSRLRELHHNQLLVLDPNGRLAGYVGLEDLLKVHSQEHASSGRARPGAGADGASKESRVVVRGLVKQPLTLAPEAKLRDAARLMQRDGINFVAVVDEDGTPQGVISRSNIVERVAAQRPQTGVLCQVVGLNGIDQADLEPIYSAAQRSLKKISTELRPDFLSLHYKVSKAKPGGRGDSKYSLSVHLSTEGRFWVQKAEAWDPLEATQEAMRSLERRINEEKELRLDRRKTPRRRARFYEATPA